MEEVREYDGMKVLRCIPEMIESSILFIVAWFNRSACLRVHQRYQLLRRTRVD